MLGQVGERPTRDYKEKFGFDHHWELKVLSLSKKRQQNKKTNLILDHILLGEVLTSIISQKVRVINMQITNHSKILNLW